MAHATFATVRGHSNLAEPLSSPVAKSSRLAGEISLEARAFGNRRYPERTRRISELRFVSFAGLLDFARNEDVSD